jgi:hypothetical protein
LRIDNDLNRLETRAIIAIAARLAVRVMPLVSASDESTRIIERLFELAAGTSAIDPKIPKSSGSGSPECWGRADDVLRRCEQTAKAFSGNESGHEVTDDVRLFVASLVDDAIGTALSFDASGEGDLLARAIMHDLSATEKMSGPDSGVMGRPIDPSSEGELGPYWPAGRPHWWPSED